jgi:hypothetical protein
MTIGIQNRSVANQFGPRGALLRRLAALFALVALVGCAPEKEPKPESEGLDEGNGGDPATRPTYSGGVPTSTSMPKPPATGADPQVDSGAGLPDGSVAVAPDASAGCRAPDELGCSTCCTEDPLTASCVSRTGASWYNVVGSAPGLCPTDCPPCARCSLRDEEQLRGLVERPECGDCSGDLGPDPCFTPGGCACYCATRLELVERCGELSSP